MMTVANNRNRRRGGQNRPAVERNDSPTLIPLTVNGEEVGHFRAAPKPPLWAFLKFAAAAKDGIDSADMSGLAAMYDLIRAAIDKRDWPGFEAAADEHQPDPEELLAVVSAALEAATGRPTARPAASSAGPQRIASTSTAAWSSPVTRPRLAAEVAELTPVSELARRTG